MSQQVWKIAPFVLLRMTLTGAVTPLRTPKN